MNTSLFPRRARAWAAALALPLFGQAATDQLDGVEKSAGEWVKLRMETARLDGNWQSERALLESTVTALQERATLAEEERDLLKARTAREREELATLQSKAKSADEELLALEARLKALSGQLIASRPSLPPRLSDALEMSFRSLAEPGLALGERMQVCMTVLNRCVQFNRMVSSGEEALKMTPTDETKSLEVIYWGLSHGYALDRPAGQAWLGSPGPQGWRWEVQPEAASGVARLIAIFQDRADPDFVLVPAALQHLPTEASHR